MALEAQKHAHTLKTVDNSSMRRVIYTGFNVASNIPFTPPSSSPVNGSGGGLPLQPKIKLDYLNNYIQDFPVLK